MKKADEDKLKALEVQLIKKNLELITAIAAEVPKIKIKYPSHFEEQMKLYKEHRENVAKVQVEVQQLKAEIAGTKLSSSFALTEKYNRALCALKFLRLKKFTKAEMREMNRLLMADGFSKIESWDRDLTVFTTELSELKNTISKLNISGK